MSRLVFLHGSNDLYGASRVLLGDVEILTRLGNSVRVVLPCDGSLSWPLNRAGAEVLIRPLRVLRRVRRSSALEWPLHLPVPTAPNELVVLWTLALLPYLPILRANRARVVVAVHELLAGRAGALMARCASLSPGLILANSAATARWLMKHGCDPRKIRTAYPAANPYRPLARSAASSAFRVLVAGRVSGGKGHVQAIDAVKVLRSRGIDAELTLAGAPFPGQEAHLRRLLTTITQLPWARYVGEIPDLGVLLEDHDVLLMASVAQESFGLVALEAWAAGRRTIAPDEGGAAEAARLVDGVVFPPRDVQAMASALALVAREPALRGTPRGDAPAARACTSARRREIWEETLVSSHG